MSALSVQPTSNQQLVHCLQQRIGGWERASASIKGKTTRTEEVVSSGCAGLDRLLPWGGLPRGRLLEWLGVEAGSGAASLSLHCAQQVCRQGGVVVVIDPQRQVYPPALAGWGLDLEQVVLVHPGNRRDELWTWDQSLRCSGVAAVWGWVEQFDPRGFRRLQLSAESSDGLGLLIRPEKARHQPTWADASLCIQPQTSAHGRRLRVELVRCRGAASGGAVSLVLDEWTGQLQEVRESDAPHSRALVAQLARTAVTAYPAARGAKFAAGDRAV